MKPHYRQRKNIHENAQPTAEQTNAISVFCACKQKLKQLDEEKHSVVNPLLQKEEQTKSFLYDSMKQHDLSCFPLRNVVNEHGNPYYLVKKTNTSNRSITKDRIQQGLDNIKLNPQDVISFNHLEKLNNDIYNCVRNMCVVQKPTVLVTSIPPKSVKKKTSSVEHDMLICQQNPELYKTLEKHVTILQNYQKNLKNTRYDYDLRKRDLEKQKNNTEKCVVRYLQDQHQQKRKLRFTSVPNSAPNTMMLQCRNINTTSHTKHVGLKQFKTFLNDSLIESCPGNRPIRWFELKPILMQRLLKQIEDFKYRHEKKNQSQRIYLLSAPSK